MTKILIVDDSDLIREQVRDMLEENGYEVAEAVDGQDGLDKAKEEKFDLIVVDYNMPVKDGLEMSREVLKLPEYKEINILMLTTEAGSALKKKGKDAGIRAWMVKPPKKEVLIKCIGKLLA